jgi:hypothetical protein
MHHIEARVGVRKKLQHARRVSRARRVFASHPIKGFVSHTPPSGERKSGVCSRYIMQAASASERGAVNRSSSTLPTHPPLIHCLRIRVFSLIVRSRHKAGACILTRGVCVRFMRNQTQGRIVRKRARKTFSNGHGMGKSV